MVATKNLIQSDSMVEMQKFACQENLKSFLVSHFEGFEPMESK